ncbi:hypothetical protein LZZ85_04050 [Terrimonas sp. NA20]|uniref:DUF4288 domain-containing protein n=1 Tax=Terrimonas ginsenosidimutans TaxID=2908004 RepID=A0ABS9KM85_9BACT|nr:hypothetical protein [Terrimonas ginsenosidimutans]MCG2613435.1 hypothetical protein [Terrimonas ginsenosidimutans]
MEKKYYFFYLEMALRMSSDSRIYAFKNISHVPTSKLVEIFEIDVLQDPYMSEGYFLTEEIYLKHESYIKEKMGAINLEVFEYCFRYYTSEDGSSIRRLYKEDLME